MKLEALWLEFKEKNQVFKPRDVSFLNSLETLLTNEIVWGLVLVSNFFPVWNVSSNNSFQNDVII